MKTTVFQMRLTDSDKEKITTLAGQSGCSSVSEYVRACALNKKLHSQFDLDFSMALIKANADMSRLGNLFRLSLKDNNKYNAEQLKLIEDNLLVASRKIKELLLS